MTTTNNAAFEIPDFVLGVLEANVDMSTEATWQFTAVSVVVATGVGLLGPCAIDRGSAGDNAVGILQNNPVLAEAAQVVTSGVSKAKYGGAVAGGALLKRDASGLLITATTGTVAVAQALQPGVSGDIKSVLVKNFGVQP